MISFDDVTKENKSENNPNLQEIPDHSFRILIVGSSGSLKTNALLNLMNQILIKLIYMLKIHTTQNVNFLLINVKMLEQRILKIKSA